MEKKIGTIKRLPRKKKKKLKSMYKHRYGIDWLGCGDLIEEYIWFFKNPFYWDMNKSLSKKYWHKHKRKWIKNK